jgi:hypothetical protein
MLSATVLALLLGLPIDAQAPPAVAVEAPPPPTDRTERWVFSFSMGRSFYDSQPHDVWPTSNNMWQLSHRQTEFRVTRQGTPLVVGGALHKIAYPAIPDTGAIGAGLVFGAHYPLASWFSAEFDGTLGLQLYTGRDVVYGATATGDLYPIYFTRSGQVDLFVRLNAGIALSAASWLDVLVGLNLHMDPGGDGHYLGAASVGLRCPLP